MPAANYGSFSLLGTGIKKIYHIHTKMSEAHRYNIFMKIREKLISALTNTTIFVSQDVKSDYKNTFNPFSLRARVLSGGIPEATPSGSIKSKESLGISGNEKVVTCIASLTAHKNHRNLINAFQNIFNAKLLIVGEGPLREELEDLVQNLSLTDRVSFLGIRQDVGRIFSASEICVLSSTREGLGLSLIEAQRAGIPSVATDIGGIPEVIDDGVNGFLVESDNPEELAEKINFLLENDEKRKVMGQAAREKFLEKYELKKYVDKLILLYSDR